MDEILPGLFLGDIFGARSPSLLRENGITHILSVYRGSLANMEETTKELGIARMQIEVDDYADEDLVGRGFEEGAEFIDGALKGGGKVFVHCLQGISRSGAVVAAYVMKSKSLTRHAAISLVQSKRPRVRPNRGFWEQLGVWEIFCRDQADGEERMRNGKKRGI